MTIDITNDLDDYLAAIQDLKHEIDQYKDVAGVLQIASTWLNKATTSNKESSEHLERFAASAQSQLTEIDNRISKTLIEIEKLDLDGLYVRLGRRYDTHQERLNELATSVDDAVREQQRLGLQLLQQTAVFQTDLSASTVEVRGHGEQLRQVLTSLSSGFSDLEATVSMKIAESEALGQQGIARLKSTLDEEANTLAKFDRTLKTHMWLLILVALLAAASLVAAIAG
jgi:DNA anti-recombination protein RmuC